MTDIEKPAAARPLFRRLALSVSVVCFLLAGLFGIMPDRFLAPADDSDRWLTVGVCFLVGLNMLVISKTGFWPPRRI